MPKEVFAKVGPEFNEKLAQRHLKESGENTGRFFNKSRLSVPAPVKNDDQQQPENGLAKKLLDITQYYLNYSNPPHDNDTLWQKIKYHVLCLGEEGRTRALHNQETLKERTDFELLGILYPQLAGWKVPEEEQHHNDPKLDSSHTLRLHYFHAFCDFFKVSHTPYALAFMICNKYSGLTPEQINDYATNYAAKHTTYASFDDPEIESEHHTTGLEKLAVRVLQKMELKEVAAVIPENAPAVIPENAKRLSGTHF